MHAQTAKQEAMEAIQRLPDSVGLDEIVYRLYVLNKIHHGMKEADQGKGFTSEELQREIEQW
jgi:predicted transcriptional regulator